MGINHHPRHAKDSAEDHVRRLAPYTVQLQQLFHRLGHDPAELLFQRPGHPDDGPRLLPVKSR